jgi:hypothetical protein
MAYDSSKTAFSWGGVAARGVADGEFINWDFPNDEVTTYVGSRGEGSNVVSPDKRCTITVTLQSDSPTNTQWEALRLASFEGPALLRDRSSTAVVAFAEQAMVTKQPAVSRSRDKPVTVWVFTAPRGNATPLAT